MSAQPPNSPLQQPITFHPALLLLAAYCGNEALHTSRQTEKIKENEEKEETERTTRESLALISKIFQGDRTGDAFFFFFFLNYLSLLYMENDSVKATRFIAI